MGVYSSNFCMVSKLDYCISILIALFSFYQSCPIVSTVSVALVICSLNRSVLQDTVETVI